MMYLSPVLYSTTHPFVWNRLTVLAYHRIADVHDPAFETFRPNVSATPADFARQMEFVARHFNIVSVDDVVAFIRDGRRLPHHALLVTFDDGYLDNYEQAFPVLNRMGIPAVFFLTTGFLDRQVSFYWDMVAYCFHHTRLTHADLPLLGWREWTTDDEKDFVLEDWFSVIKSLPEHEKQACAARVPDMLEVNFPKDALANLPMTWDQVREMARAGMTFGGHTVNHPILTRIPLEEAQNEIIESRRRVEQETGADATVFAYTNGLRSDFNADLQRFLTEQGFQAAFTLMTGPAYPREVLAEPMAIRRIFLGWHDTFHRFRVKLTPVPRMLGQNRRFLRSLT
ncbi:MAG: polysaccharide deacetylase family protein [Anaerolineae bacterium]|nr:polysaccharide deacetylase family protein [Anaerolineae bacterium]